MSFFKELKEDIVQSVNELSDALDDTAAEGTTGAEGEGSIEQEVQKELDSMMDVEVALPDVSEENDGEKTEAEDLPDLAEASEAMQFQGEMPSFMQEDSDEPEEKDEQEVSDMKDSSKENEQEEKTVSTMNDQEQMGDNGEMYNSEETTVITKGTTINGGIRSDTSLIVKGIIEGDVECQGKLTITGRVAGNSTAAEIYVNTPRLTGNLVSKGSVKVDVGTVVIGNISSASVVVAGAVKGDIDVNGPIVVDSTAVVQGAIIGKSIQINSGAVVDGTCSLKYADVDLDSFFE